MSPFLGCQQLKVREPFKSAAEVDPELTKTSLRVAAERKVQQNEARLLFLGALGKETAKVTTRTRSWDHDEDTGEYLEVAS
jgi:hypothetical protein